MNVNVYEVVYSEDEFIKIIDKNERVHYDIIGECVSEYCSHVKYTLRVYGIAARRGHVVVLEKALTVENFPDEKEKAVDKLKSIVNKLGIQATPGRWEYE